MLPVHAGEELLDLEVIRDLADVTADSGGAFLRGVLERFTAEAGNALERMDGYVRCGDSVSLAREAHRLKGSSGTVGARRLADECLQIERWARAGGCAGIEPTIERARGTLDETRSGLCSFFHGTEGHGGVRCL